MTQLEIIKKYLDIRRSECGDIEETIETERNYLKIIRILPQSCINPRSGRIFRGTSKHIDMRSLLEIEKRVLK